jgi:hypothetical protein
VTERSVTTYTMWSLFRNCRKAAQYRYVLDLVPMERDRNLAFGSLVHEALETWHRTRNLAATLDHVDRACANRAADEEQRRTWHLATAMLTGYAARYPAEDFEVVALEKTFEGEITNPATGAASRSFVLAGKVDGIVRIGEENWLLEHKTASVLDGSYLDRLWGDFQVVLYSYYVEQALGIRIAGVLYNVLVKARLQQGAGETEAEFEARHAELVAKSKSGKSSAQRRMPESDEDFQHRLSEKYADPAMFHRERLFVSREQFDTLRAELWELTQAFLDARRRGVFYQNTSQCFQYGRPCPYLPLCRSGGNPNLVENLYEKLPPHQELRADAAAEVAPF